MKDQKKNSFTNVQLELLRTFSHELSDKDLIELKKVLARFFAERLIGAADKAWDKNNWQGKEHQLLKTKMRKKS